MKKITLFMCMAVITFLSAEAQIIQGGRQLRYKGEPGEPILVPATIAELEKFCSDDDGTLSQSLICTLEDIIELSERYPGLKKYRIVCRGRNELVENKTEWGWAQMYKYSGNVAQYNNYRNLWEQSEFMLGLDIFSDPRPKARPTDKNRQIGGSGEWVYILYRH